MTIGERIAIRRKELGMTQMDLATKLGYKSKTTVNKIERGVNELKQSMILNVARALQTTPIYILGLGPDDIEQDPNLSDAHIELICIVKNMTETQAATYLDLIKRLLASSGSEEKP